MRSLWIPAALLACLLLFPPAILGGTGNGGEEGKEIFLKYRCNSCHAIRAKDIGAEKEEEEEAEGEEAVKPPDLSGVGSEYDAEWLHLYLRKKVAKDERKHKKRFKGKQAERTVLVDWLITLKSPVETDK